MSEHQADKKAAQCSICKNFHDVQIPKHIVEALYKGNLVIFAGAGVSTENKTVLSYTLYADIKNELGISPSTRISFPKLMSRFCAQPDGRAKLLQKIQERFDYIRSFPEIYRSATKFHSELSTLHLVQNIVTTNWDDYFEKECGATPFVTPEDFVLWNAPRRKVFKIHGSINNYGSIVATDEDYRKCFKNLRDGILGSALKQMLSTKTIIYVGYSFNDEDFNRIHQLLKREMGALLPHGYVVTPDCDSGPLSGTPDLTPIYTDATYFISLLKQHAIADQQMLDDERFLGVEQLLQRVDAEHAKLYETYDICQHPEVLYAGSYQDGIIHCCERMLALKNTGHYSHICNVTNAIHGYESIRKDKLKAKRYSDIAYIDGYMNGLIYLLVDDKSRNEIPLYYIFGTAAQPRTFAEYKKLCKQAEQLHKTAYGRAKKVAPAQPGFIVHHVPTLL